MTSNFKVISLIICFFYTSIIIFFFSNNFKHIFKGFYSEPFQIKINTICASEKRRQR